MKTQFQFLCLLLLFFESAVSAQDFPLSDGLYRIPYANNTKIYVQSDVSNHDPLGCFDMWGVEGTTYQIVAAASGWIRAIRDTSDRNCHPSLPSPDNWFCGEFNNYVVLEHPNGEWSTYIHLAKNSITGLGHEVGDWVEAGTVLGQEGNVGCSTRSHLHFEVARPHDPDDPQPWSSHSGVVRADGKLLNPIFCNASDNNGLLIAKNYYTAGSCNDNCPTNLTVNSSSGTYNVHRADQTITSTSTYGSGIFTIYRAGNVVELKPGFNASWGSDIKMLIKTCNQQN